jgi:hypothetical protein
MANATLDILLQTDPIEAAGAGCVADPSRLAFNISQRGRA